MVSKSVDKTNKISKSTHCWKQSASHRPQYCLCTITTLKSDLSGLNTSVEDEKIIHRERKLYRISKIKESWISQISICMNGILLMLWKKDLFVSVIAIAKQSKTSVSCHWSDSRILHYWCSIWFSWYLPITSHLVTFDGNVSVPILREADKIFAVFH